MAVRLSASAVLTDIEGTTSDIAFVKDVLFPYARDRLPEFVRSHAQDPGVRALLEEAARLAGTHDDQATVAALLEWIDSDRKVTPLKTLQGLIWEAGYAAGELCGHVYPDAVERLREWHARGLALYVYSSGSVRAQQLLFGHTGYGDLGSLFSGYFDTHVGYKSEPASYSRIVADIGRPPGEVLFLSDIEAELDAARAAGLATVWLRRDATSLTEATHPQVADFHAIEIETP